MHRLVLLARHATLVDHINRDKLDNRRENLRYATQSQQNANKEKFHGRSRFKGVHRRWDGRKWVAQIKVHNRRLSLGCFVDEEDAARAYNRAAREYFGEYACLNDVSEPEEV